MLEAAGTKNCEELWSTNAGLKANTRWLMRSGLLGMYSLAKEQIYRAEKHTEDANNKCRRKQQAQGTRCGAAVTAG